MCVVLINEPKQRRRVSISQIEKKPVGDTWPLSNCITVGLLQKTIAPNHPTDLSTNGNGIYMEVILPMIETISEELAYEDAITYVKYRDDIKIALVIVMSVLIFLTEKKIIK